MNRDRRRLLQVFGAHPLLWVGVASVSVLLGRALGARDRQGRLGARKAPSDLPPIPWLGHC